MEAYEIDGEGTLAAQKYRSFDALLVDRNDKLLAVDENTVTHDLTLRVESSVIRAAARTRM